MNKIRIIDLLVKLANNKEVPKTIKIKDTIYKYDKNVKWYFNDFGEDLFVSKDELTREIEILEEEKKIPEKLEGIDSLFKIEQDLDLKGFLAWQKSNNKIIENKINEIIDYLKSKGE